MKEIRIRQAEPEDAGELLEIYAYYVTETAVTFEYDVPDEAEFAERIRRTRRKYPYLVAEEDGRIIGYAYAGEFKGRAAYQWSVETSIYIHKDYRQGGLGRRLYQEMEDILKRQNILNMNACIAYPVTEDEYLTKDSVHFHERMGFAMVGEFHNSGYKFERWYDMVWMEKLMGTHQAKQPSVIPYPEL